MTEPKPIPQVVHVAVCRLCGRPATVATAKNGVDGSVCGTLECNGAVTVERFRHDPPVSRNGRKPRKWQR